MGKGSKKKNSTRKNTDQFSKIPVPVVLILLVLELVFGVVFIIIGSINTNKCNIDKMIPIWLIMMGVVFLISGVHELIQLKRSKSRSSSTKGRGIVALVVTGVLAFLTVGLFVAGNVFVYRAWGIKPDYGHYWFENGCDMGAYLLAFVSVIIMDVLIGGMLIGVLFIAIYNCFTK